MRDACMARLRGVEREFNLARHLISEFIPRSQADPTRFGDTNTTSRDAKALLDNLEATYLIRLFAEFEQALRNWWQLGLKKESTPTMSALLDSVASKRKVPKDNLESAHHVRMHRNHLVHDESEAATPVVFKDACAALCRFLSRLPPKW